MNHAHHNCRRRHCHRTQIDELYCTASGFVCIDRMQHKPIITSKGGKATLPDHVDVHAQTAAELTGSLRTRKLTVGRRSPEPRSCVESAKLMTAPRITHRRPAAALGFPPGFNDAIRYQRHRPVSRRVADACRAAWISRIYTFHASNSRITKIDAALIFIPCWHFDGHSKASQWLQRCMPQVHMCRCANAYDGLPHIFR